MKKETLLFLNCTPISFFAASCCPFSSIIYVDEQWQQQEKVRPGNEASTTQSMIILSPKVHLGNNITLYTTKCDKLLEPPIAWKTTSELFNVHVKDVVTDWSYALAGFLVSTLFLCFPRPIIAIFHIASVFLPDRFLVWSVIQLQINNPITNCWEFHNVGYLIHNPHRQWSRTLRHTKYTGYLYF